MRPALDDLDDERPAEETTRAHWKGRRDGLVEVACYCGRTTSLMTWDDLWNGVAPPACLTVQCRREEQRRR